MFFLEGCVHVDRGGKQAEARNRGFRFGGLLVSALCFSCRFPLHVAHPFLMQMRAGGVVPGWPRGGL